MEAAAEALGDNCRKTLSKPFRGSFRLDRSCGGAWITAPRAARPAAGAMAPWGAMGSAGTGGGGGGWIHPGNTAGGNIRDARRNEKTIEGGAAPPPPGGVRQLDHLGRGRCCSSSARRRPAAGSSGAVALLLLRPADARHLDGHQDGHHGGHQAGHLDRAAGRRGPVPYHAQGGGNRFSRVWKEFCRRKPCQAEISAKFLTKCAIFSAALYEV